MVQHRKQMMKWEEVKKNIVKRMATLGLRLEKQIEQEEL